VYEILSRLDVHFIVRTNSVDVDNLEWMVGSEFLHEALQADLGTRDTILDLGSHIGTFALPVVARTHCKTICFEPDAESLALSRANFILNRLDHLAEFHQAAVGGADGTLMLHEAVENWGHTILADGGPANALTGTRREVPLMSLDSVLHLVPNDDRLFVKVNTEGAEFDIFRNASEQALQRIDTLVGEIHYDLGPGDFQPCLARLRGAGFQIELAPLGEMRAILVAKRATSNRCRNGEQT
jgi:FkbM family methyltransferase